MIAVLSWVGALFVLMSVRDRTLRIALYCLFAALTVVAATTIGPSSAIADGPGGTPAPPTTTAPKPTVAPSPDPAPAPTAAPAPERDNNDLTNAEKEGIVRAEFGADAARMICIMYRESGGNAHARNKRSGAAGAFQFTSGSTGSFKGDVKKAKNYHGRRGFQPWGNACGGGSGGGGGGGAIPVVACIDHAEWVDVTWTVVVSVEACDLPEPPDWAEDQRPSQGCGWTGLETQDPKWLCSLKLGPGQTLRGTGKVKT